jgi:hypothetical protein
MRRHRIIFLATAMALVAACQSNKKDVEAAKSSAFDADFAVIYSAAIEATRANYPNLEDAPGRGAIKTAWHQISNANTEDNMANSPTMSSGPGIGRANQSAANQAASGMPTRLAYKRFFIRFDVAITGGRPWRLKVVGHASMWEPGAAEPTELRGAARPSWLESRTDALIATIYKRIKAYAVPLKETISDEAPRADPAAFTDVPPPAAKVLAALKDAVAVRDYAALRPLLADDVVWSLGGGTGADVALATWQADPEPLEAMTTLMAAGCGGDAKKVTCPAGPPKPGTYQVVLEPRADTWRVTSFVRAE